MNLIQKAKPRAIAWMEGGHMSPDPVDEAITSGWWLATRIMAPLTAFGTCLGILLCWLLDMWIETQPNMTISTTGAILAGIGVIINAAYGVLMIALTAD